MAGVPPTFIPKPVEAKSRPKPSPPKFLKHQVYEDASVFRRIDEHAIMVARYPHKNFRDLMWDLVYCANFTDLEKVRIIFRWMTAKNMYIIQFDQELPGTPEEVLTAFRRRKGTFAKILETMCIHAGLHCVTVNGFAKGVDYHPGKIFTGTAYNHSWNAVNIAGSWQLIDAHWATRYLSSEKNLPENLVYEYDDFYFLMEPQQAVYSHFPEDSTWQLLPRPVNLAQYEDLPLAKSQFFKCYLDFLENNHGVVRTKDGKLQMTLAFWRPCTFTFKLVFVDSFAEEYRGQDLKNYVLQETTGNRINFFLRAPTKGEFYLTIYAQHIPDKLTIETTFRAAAEYKIICDKAAEDSHPYPKCSDTNWGPGYPVSQFDLIPNTKEGVITAPNGHADVGFYKNDPNVNLLAKLKKPGMDDQALERCVKEQDRGNECNFSIDLPQRGEYGLEIYANKPEDGTTYTHMCQYMLAYPEKPQGDKQFKENYDLTPVTSAKPGSAHMIKPYGTYQPGTGSLAADAGMVKKSPTKKGKKGPATAPKPGQQHAYEEELPPPPPEFLQPMHDTEFQYVPRKDETTSYPSLAAQAATGSMRPGDERMGPYQGRKPAGAPGSPGVQEEAINPQYAGQQQSAPGSYGQPGVGYGYPGDRGSGYGPGDRGSGYGPGDRGSGYGPGDKGKGGPGGDRGSGYGSPGERGSGYGSPGDRGSGYGTPGDRGSGYGSPGYGSTDRGNEAPYPGYRGAPLESSEAYIEPNWTTTLNLELAPPEDFIPQKVESKTSSAQHAAPAPAPPPQGADAEFHHQQEVNDEKFKAVDQHAIEVSQMDHKNFRDMVWHLIYARSISDELEKARAIFLWLCTKDLNKVSFTSPDKDSPEEILMGLKTGKTTYAQIFETLCSYAGLHCVILTGFAKGAEYKPGMKFTGREGQHSWNAVLIHGIWRLVDCHWAARRLIGKHTNVENVRYELDLYYFGPNSAQLIYTHFPEEQDWQLLKRPISQPEFEQLAPVKSAFFKYGLELKSHRQAVIDCNGEVTLAITFPPHRTDLAFTFSISTDDGQDVVNGVKLSQYGMQETRGNEAIFRLRFPDSGSYKLLIYAKEVDLAHKDAVYGAVCEYRIDASLPPGKVITPYPPCPQTTWGPAEAASRYAFQPLQQGSVLHSFDGSCEVKFTMPRTLRFMAKLKSNDHKDADLENCAIFRSINDEAVFKITFPTKGEYGLEVYANDPEKDGNTLYHVWQYMIISETGGSTKGISLPPGYLGPQPKFAQLGLETTSHSDPYITTNEGIVTIDLRTSQPIRITTQLLYASDGANDDMSQYVLQQMHGEMLSFVCKLPKTGAYKLQIFALPYTDPSESLPGVFNFVIETSGHAVDDLPFPKQFAQWKEGCFLSSPQVGHLDKSLDRNGSVFFNLSVPKAGAVAVVVGEDWTQLDDKAGRWQGDVPFAEHWGKETKVSLCANYGSVQSSYSTLLEFSM